MIDKRFTDIPNCDELILIISELMFAIVYPQPKNISQQLVQEFTMLQRRSFSLQSIKKCYNATYYQRQ